ncbi:MAG TPA: heterodisulfide reductase-related iron-sulfur binding cluster [Longimicrobiales bacterium]
MTEGGVLARALAREEEGLLTCVHCGFCLPACPTYTRLGDENDSPRGRLHLMRAVAEGRLGAGSDAFHQHIDRCLGCRACEPVCPAGVPYGRLLELARAESAAARPPGFMTRALLRTFASPGLTRAVMLLGRWLRATGLPAFLAARLPGSGILGGLRLAMGMLASTGGWPGGRQRGAEAVDVPVPSHGTAGLLTGCVQQGLFSTVNDATVRVLEANGVAVTRARGQVCCGAVHAHAGDLEAARDLARRNVDAFERSGVEWVVTNAAGCGAILKEYAHLLADDGAYAERAVGFTERVRDVSELLADRGPRTGARLSLEVTWDAPCHLLHAQGISREPAAVLAAIPGLDLRTLERADECCGGAGIYGLTHPDLGGSVGADKVKAVLATGAEVVVTPNPGCIMQIGAGLRIEGSSVRVAHPVELLDESYRRAGYYR